MGRVAPPGSGRTAGLACAALRSPNANRNTGTASKPSPGEMHARCPLAWTDTPGGHWIAAGHREVFELARCHHVSSDRDYRNERRGYQGIFIPTTTTYLPMRNGILEMDDPEHGIFRAVLNPYLSPSRLPRRRASPAVDRGFDRLVDAGR
ncbi:hypothetical protein [Nocardia asiatica]|uniref:hypothetical protein n=1 Tax=Nocardia asiatica TaxID=209252 RepID=UPI003EE29179